MVLSYHFKLIHVFQTNFKLHAGFKKCHFGNLQTGPVSASRIPHLISKNLFALGPDEILSMLEGKIRVTPLFKVQFGKITRKVLMPLDVSEGSDAFSNSLNFDMRVQLKNG